MKQHPNAKLTPKGREALAWARPAVFTLHRPPPRTYHSVFNACLAAKRAELTLLPPIEEGTSMVYVP